MSRNQYVVSFPKATPGDEVTWPNAVQVFADAQSLRPLASAVLGEGESPSATLFSDAVSVAFTCPRTGETLTCTTGSPSQTGGQPSGGGDGASEQSAVSMESDGTFDGAFVGGWSIDIDSGSSGVSVDADDHSLINVPAGVYTANVLGEISGWADATSVYAVVTGVDSRYGDSGNATAPAPITDGGGQITGSVGWFHMAAPGQIQVKLFVTGSAGEATDYVGFDLLRLGPPFGA